MPSIDARAPLLDTRLPLALLPVRIETRFVQEHGAFSLLVRIFPDEVHVDRHGTLPPRARLLPDAFVVLGYADQGPAPPPAAATPGGALFAMQGNPILEDPSLAPDPNATGHDPWDSGSRWLVDFGDAERRGLAIRVPIDAATAQRGLARLVVLGVRRGGDDAAHFADLLAAHRQSDGLGLVPSGTPTNNTANAPSGWISAAAPPGAPVVIGSDGAQADQALGLPGTALAAAPNGNRRQLDGSRRMNTLLWRATWGYFLEQMMAAADSHHPLLGGEALSWVRSHFTSFVRADGPLPTVRIGRQPYGLLPVTSLADWPEGDPTERLARLLRSVRDRLFRPAAANLPHLVPGQPNLDRVVGDLLAQQAHAWRYSGRSLLGAQYARTLFALMRWPLTPDRTEPALQFFERPPPPEDEEVMWGPWEFKSSFATPAHLPWTGDEQLLSQFFLDREAAASRLLREVLGDLGVSWRPRLGLAVFIDAAFPIDKLVGDGSYLVGLRADTKTFAAMRDEKPPALLDQLARHALLLEGAAAAGRRGWDPELFNVDVAVRATADLWSEEVLGVRTVAALAGVPGTSDLAEVRDALTLGDLPPDELTRLLTGTLDTCSHRLDAWITSLAQRRLAECREASPTGLYIGAYGWVVNLRPQTAARVVPDEHVLAPSLDHAVTAAILRAGYQAHRGDGDSAMAVDLSSTRVRLALWLLDGVRQGQPLGALLGYRFERGLQERSQPGHLLGPFIEPFRRLAPLGGDLVTSGVTESAAAHDVVDGLALARIYQRNRDALTPLPLGVTATFEARVRVDRVDADFAAIVAKMDRSAESEYLFAVSNDRRLVLAWHTEGGMTWGTPSFNLAASTQLVPLGQWVHLAAVRDGATIRFYIDGRDAGASTAADARRFRPSATHLPVRIGVEKPGVRAFVGRVREVRLWCIAHEPGDVPRLAAGPLGGKAPGLAACWRLEEGSGASVVDCSPYRRDGTVLGGGNPPWVQVSRDEDPLWGNGPALELNGTQFVEVPHAQNLSLGAVEGLEGLLTAGVEQTLITAELDALCDAVDAVSDLTLAESVHHVALGNPSRAGAVLDALSRGDVPPPELEVARTPRGAVVHAHRLAVLFEDGGTHADAWSTDPSRLRAAVEPLVNEWAATILGGPGRVPYRCDYLDANGAVVASREYALNESGLSLSPLDIVYSAPGKGDPGSDELERRLRYQRMLRPPSGVVWSTVRLDLARRPEWSADQLSVPELLEAAAAVRRVLDQARPFVGGDLLATGELDVVDAADLGQRAVLANGALAARKAELAAAETNPANLRQALLAASFAGVPGAVPGGIGTGDADRAALAGQARAVTDEIDRRLSRAAAAPDDMSRLGELFAGCLRIVPRLRLTPELRDGLRAAFRQGQPEPGWGGATLNAAAWNWLSRLARVRDAVGRLDDLLLYDTALNGSASPLRVAQLPVRDGEGWIGLPGPSASLPGGRVSLVAWTPGSLDLERLAGGLVIDQWTETVPRPTHTAGLAFHLDAPGAAPPQAILIAVPNDKRPQWDLAALEAVLLETLELTPLRMVGPRDLGPANHFLPATLLAFNPAGDTVSTDLVGGE